MKKIKNNLIVLVILVLLILKHIYIEKNIPNWCITIFGTLLVAFYYLYFKKIYTNLSMKYINICLVILVFSGLITVSINASNYISDLVVTNGVFRLIVIISKWAYLLLNFYFLNTAYTVKKYRILSLMFLGVAYLNIFEMFVEIEAIIEIIAILIDYGLGKYGRIIDIQKKNNK